LARDFKQLLECGTFITGEIAATRQTSPSASSRL
jgi:hypothetical protein